MKPAIYARVSTTQQEEDGSIETQLDYIFHDAAVRAKYGNPEGMPQYLDDGVSGRRKPLWDRPAGKQLMADAKAGNIDVVITYKYNRLGRKAIDTEQAIDELLTLGVIVYDAKTGTLFDNNDAASRVFRQMLGILAEYEVNNDTEAMRDGMERKARAGALMPTFVRLGYDWSRTITDEEDTTRDKVRVGRKAPGAKLIVNTEEAKLVQRIFSLYQQMPQTKVAWLLNEEGLRKPCKVRRRDLAPGATERLFDAKAIRDIITDELYTGMVEWGATTTIPGHTPVPHRHHFPELQIISFEQFNAVQSLMESRRKVPNKSAGSPYIYSGLMRCHLCGGKTVGKRQWHESYNYQETRRYECRNRNIKGKVACRGSSAFEQTVTKAVIPFLVDLLENRLHLQQYVEAEAKAMMWEEHEGKSQRLQGQIEAARAQLKNIQTLAVQGVMTGEEARPFVYDARETIERCEAQLKGIEQQIIVKDELADAVSRVCTDIRGSLEALDPMALQTVVRQVFQWFSIGKHGHGNHIKVWIHEYELREELKGLLATHIESITPALVLMWSAEVGRIFAPIAS